MTISTCTQKQAAAASPGPSSRGSFTCTIVGRCLRLAESMWLIQLRISALCVPTATPSSIMVAVCGPLTKCDNFWQSQGTPIPALQQRAANSHSMASKRDKLKTYCSLYDLERVEIIEDAGQSAKPLNRPGLQRALQMLRDGEADGLVIVKLLRSPLTVKPPPARANREPMRRSSRCPKSETLGTAQLIRCPAETSPRSPGNQGFPVERSNGAASRLRSDRSRRPSRRGLSSCLPSLPDNSVAVF